MRVSYDGDDKLCEQRNSRENVLGEISRALDCHLNGAFQREVRT